MKIKKSQKKYLWKLNISKILILHQRRKKKSLIILLKLNVCLKGDVNFLRFFFGFSHYFSFLLYFFEIFLIFFDFFCFLLKVTEFTT